MKASEGVGVGGGRTKGERDLRIPVNFNAKLWLYISDLILLGKCAFPLRLFLKIYMWSLSAFSYAQLPSVIDKNK